MTRFCTVFTLVAALACASCEKQRTFTAPESVKVTLPERKGGQNLTVTTPDGQSMQVAGNAAGVPLPADFPSELAYPDAKVVAALTGKQAMDVSFSTADSAQKVLDYYEEKLTAVGWEIKFSSHTATGGLVAAAKGKDQRACSVTASQQACKTTVAVSLTDRAK